LQPDKARKVIQEIGERRPGMANLTRSILRRLFSYAIDLGLRRDNPFDRTPRYKLGTHHTWTDAEIAQFERHWPLGTRERLAFALLLYTGQRGSDVVKMVRSDIVDGRIRVAQKKVRKGTTNELMIPVHPALARALQAGPVVGMQHIITDARGRSLRGLTALIEAAVKLAGLPPRCVAHGLRKAALRRLAEHGSTTKQIQAVSGHRTLSEIERYTARADQQRLAKAAIGLLPDKD
jgi:integrase